MPLISSPPQGGAAILSDTIYTHMSTSNQYKPDTQNTYDMADIQPHPRTLRLHSRLAMSSYDTDIHRTSRDTLTTHDKPTTSWRQQ